MFVVVLLCRIVRVLYSKRQKSALASGWVKMYIWVIWVLETEADRGKKHCYSEADKVFSFSNNTVT